MPGLTREQEERHVQALRGSAGTGALENVSQSASVRDRARAELRECKALVGRLFECADTLVSARAGTATAAAAAPAAAAATGVLTGAGADALSAEHIMEKLVSRQNALRQLIHEVAEHQRLHAAVLELEALDAAEEARLGVLGSSLRSAESRLQVALDDARPRLRALQLANKRPVDIDDVVSYGSKIAASVAAPHGWEPSQPLGPYLPPAPPEDMMRAGRLMTLTTAASASTAGAVAASQKEGTQQL